MGRPRGTKRRKVETPNTSKAECPVCFQIPRANIYQCLNGHSICDDCSTKIAVCPTCRSSGLRIRNLFAESLLDSIQFNCSWSGRGCEKTMLRSQLSAHEDHCDQNPDIIKFCSKFSPGKKCRYKFTSKGLSETENCANFINHVKRCLANIHHRMITQGQRYPVGMSLTDILQFLPLPVKPVHHFFAPIFYQLNVLNTGKAQLFFLMNMLKFDTQGNKHLFFAFVQLTPEVTPMLVKFTISGKPNPNVVSEWGPNSLPAQSWTQKVIGFKRFLEMVETSPNNQESEIPFPFSLPVSFLSENYTNADTTFDLNFTLEPTFVIL